MTDRSKSCSCASILVIFGFHEGKTILISALGKKIEKTARLVLALYRQVTDMLPTHHQLSIVCRPIVSRLDQSDYQSDKHGLPVVVRVCGKTCRPTVGQLANRRPTIDRQVFWGALLHRFLYELPCH